MGTNANPATIDPRKLRRTVHRVILTLVVCVVLYGVLRFSISALPAGHDGMAPTLPTTGARMVVDRYPAQARAIDKLDIVFYRVQGHGQLVGRVRAVPGDRLGRAGTMLTINDETTAFEAGSVPAGVVPQGRCLVLNENPSSKLADGRTLGLIEASDVVGRLVIVLPFGS